MDQNNNSFTELEKSVEHLMNAFNNILFLTPEELIITPTRNNLNEITSCLNKIFPDNRCIDVLYTNNYDKLFFGIRVNPTIGQSKVIEIIGNDEKTKLDSYKLEFDSKLFNMGLSPQELTAYTLYEISSMIGSYQIIDDLRTVIDLNMTSNEDTIYLKDSTHYAQLVIFAIKDSLTKLSSLIYKDDISEYINNPLITATDLGEFLVSAHDTIITSEGGPKDSLRASNTSILQWMFLMYRDMRTNSSTVMSTLRDAKTTTGSKLDIEEINKTIDAINRIDATITPHIEALELPKFFDAMNMSAVNEFSLFGGLKKNGLRSIEDYLYEASLRIKNLETEEDAVYVMRSISTRMNILADYIYNTPGMNDRERKHWEDVYEKYAKLREELVKKKIWNKKQYGLFFDYNQDFGDAPYQESMDQLTDSDDQMSEFVQDKNKKLAGDSSKWNKITQKEIDINEKDLETELESISFDENGEVIIESSEETTPKGYDVKSGWVGVVDGKKMEFATEKEYDEYLKEHEKPTNESSESIEDPEIQPKDDETSDPDKVNDHVDTEIDSKNDIKDTISKDIPNTIDITIPDDINESILFGTGEVSSYLFEGGNLVNPNKKSNLVHENGDVQCECGSSNITIGEGGNCTCNECGKVFIVNQESTNDYVSELEDESVFL